MIDINELKTIAEKEYSEIVKDYSMINFKLRVTLVDNSFIDINLSRTLNKMFSFHWERKDEIYRYDNFPDHNWFSVTTFPFHFHKGSQVNVETSPFSQEILQGFRDFMEFVRKNIRTPKD